MDTQTHRATGLPGGFMVMMKTLKNIVRAVLPASIIDTALATRQRRALATLPRLTFNLNPLKPVSRSQIEQAFSDPAIHAAWANDLPQIAKVMSFVDIYGGVCPGERRAIYHLVAWLKPRRVLEIGTHIGASTIAIAQALNTHSQVNSLLITSDILDVNSPEQGAYVGLNAQSPRKNLEQLSLDHLVRFEIKPALSLMKTVGEKMDMIFLDGDHSAPAVYREISAALDILADDGIILLHDFYPNEIAIFPTGTVIPGPSLAVGRIRNEVPDIRISPLGELPWETKQGIQKTTLAYVTKCESND